MRVCVCVWVRVCLLLGEGRRGFVRTSARSAVASLHSAVGGHRVNPATPSGLTHKSIPPGQQRDYGGIRLIYFCQFTYVKCLPRKPRRRPCFSERGIASSIICSLSVTVLHA